MDTDENKRSPVRGALEPAVAALLDLDDDFDAAAQSLAVSAKRIADSLERLLSTMEGRGGRR